MKLKFNRLGNLIEKVNNRNDNNLNYELMGVNINKNFMNSVANINGTDMSKYKIIEKYNFAANLMHVDRDEVIPVSLWMNERCALISPAYDVFRISSEEILPEFLMLYFKNPNFDRHGWFYSGSSIRGNLTWEKFCEIEIPYPEKKEQHKIIKQINYIYKKRSILLDKKDKLLKSIDIIYNDMILESDEPEIKLDVLFDFIRGVEPGSDNYSSIPKKSHIPFYRVGEIEDYDAKYYIPISSSKDKTSDKDDILVSFDGTVGKVAYGRKGAYSSGLRNIINKSPYNVPSSVILAIFRSAPIQNTLIKYSTGTTILHAAKAIPNLSAPINNENSKEMNKLTKPFFDNLLIIEEELQLLYLLEQSIISDLS